jgi:hydroxymethylbilane synthase
MTAETVRIGTRGSALALWQARYVKSRLAALAPGTAVEIQVIKTSGDLIQDRALLEVGGKGLFVKEIQVALLAGEVDLAVHSLKDLPTEETAGLALSAVALREDPADALVSKGGVALADLPAGAEVLTGSLRRRAQLLHARPDLKVSPVRGNVETRLRKLDESAARAMVLARAGLVRLGLEGRVAQRLDPAEFLPACGQGALAIQTRADDPAGGGLVAALDDPPTRVAVAAERAFLAELGGGCQVPVGAYARAAGGGALAVTGMAATLYGSRLLRRTIAGVCADAAASAALGRRLAGEICSAGGDEILREVSGTIRDPAEGDP